MTELGIPGIGPSTASESWALDALCAQCDPDVFFPEKGESTKVAKKICAVCTVQTECLQYAVDHAERFGVWAGYSERERRKLHQARDRGAAA